MQLDKASFRTAVLEGIRAHRKDPAFALGDADEIGLAGLDSLDMMNLVLDVETALGVNFGEISVTTSDTIDSFYDKAASGTGGA